MSPKPTSLTKQPRAAPTSPIRVAPSSPTPSLTQPMVGQLSPNPAALESHPTDGRTLTGPLCQPAAPHHPLPPAPKRPLRVPVREPVGLHHHTSRGGTSSSPRAD